MGCGQSESYAEGAEWSISFFIFAVLIYTEEERNDLEIILFMLFCGALEEVTIRIKKRLWNLVFFRIRKGSSLCGKVFISWKQNLCI